MPTTIHIPPQVLQTVDAQARKLKMSRNKYIVETLVARVALERSEARWPRSFFDDMKRWREDQGHADAVRELRKSVVSSRRNKRSIPL